MKVSFTSTKIEEREIELPCYVRFGCNYTKIIDGKNLLVINDYDFSRSIETVVIEHKNPFATDGWEYITEDRFNEVLLSVFEKLQAFIPIPIN